MPPRRRQSKPVGPFDLRTRKLPGGTELEAVTTGIALERSRGIGYMAGYGYAATLANRNTLNDATTQQPWFVADSATGLLRSQNAPQLFKEFQTEMEEIFTDKAKGKNITADKFSRPTRGCGAALRETERRCIPPPQNEFIRNGTP